MEYPEYPHNPDGTLCDPNQLFERLVIWAEAKHKELYYGSGEQELEAKLFIRDCRAVVEWYKAHRANLQTFAAEAAEAKLPHWTTLPRI